MEDPSQWLSLPPAEQEELRSAIQTNGEHLKTLLVLAQSALHVMSFTTTEVQTHTLSLPLIFSLSLSHTHSSSLPETTDHRALPPARDGRPHRRHAQLLSQVSHWLREEEAGH
jgi:hypothetical protein